MVEQNKVIRERLKPSPERLFIIWLLMFAIPVMASLLGLEYFVREYAFFSNSEQISEAFNRLDSYKESMVFEKFLFKESENWKKLKWEADWDSSGNRERSKTKIDQVIGAKSIFCLFFDKSRTRLLAQIHQPPDLAHKIVLPAPLFKRQIQFLNTSTLFNSGIISAEDDMERSKNAMTMQQLFRAMTPITLRKNLVAKNYSVLFGGELYFVYKELNGEAGPAGCLVIYRGKDMCIPRILKKLQVEHVNCRVVLKIADLAQQFKHPERFICGLEKNKDGLTITQVAEQRFVRSYVMGGGLALIDPESRKIPFLQYKISQQRLNHPIVKYLPDLRMLGVLIVMLSAVYFFHSALFGENLSRSFKQRMLFTTVLASAFPFAFFSISFYLYTQFNQFIEKINLVQQMRIKVAQTNAELNQFVSRIEVTLSQHATTLDKEKVSSENYVRQFFAQIGKGIPAARFVMIKPDKNIEVLFSERLSDPQKTPSIAIATLFPMNTLRILREKQPVERIRRDILNLAGMEVKTSSIASALQSDGALFMADQMRFHTWFSAVKVFENMSSDRVAALMMTTFEAGSLLKHFLDHSNLGKSGFTADMGKHRLKFAFFPLEKTCAPSVWSGSGHINDETLKAARIKGRSTVEFKVLADGSEKLLISKLNSGIPHLTTAITEISNQRINLYWRMVGLGTLFYLGIVFVFAGQLLDRIIVSPVMEIAANAEQIARGKATWQVNLASGDEFEELSNNFAQMVKGLQQRNLLREYVSSEALSDIESSSGDSLLPGGEYREASIVFASIKNFSTADTVQTPQQTIAMMNRFLNMADQLISTNGGAIDKVIETTLMIVFRENRGETQSHALRAVRTAYQLAQELKTAEFAGLVAGVASGKVISGRIGSYKGKLDYTVIGDPVNLAARLKKESEGSEAGIIISGSTMRLLKGKARVKFLKRCSLKGKAREYNIYELCDLREGC